MLVKGILVKDDQANQIVHTNAAVIQGALSNCWGEVYFMKHPMLTELPSFWDCMLGSNHIYLILRIKRV